MQSRMEEVISSTSPSVQALQEALNYCHDYSMEQDAENSELYHSFSSLEMENKKLQQKKEVVEYSKQQMASELWEKDRLLSQMQKELQSLKTSGQATKDEAAEIHNAFSELKEQFNIIVGAVHLKHTEYANLQDLLSQKNEEVNALNSHVIAFEYKQQQMASELQEKDRLLSQMQEELQSLKTSGPVTKDEAPEIHNAYTELKEQFSNVVGALHLKHTECASLQDLLRQKNEEVNALNSQAIAFESKQQQMESECQEQNRLLGEMKKEFQALKTMQKTLMGQVKTTCLSFKQQYINLAGMMQVKSNECTSLRNELSQKIKEVESMKVCAEKVKSDLEKAISTNLEKATAQGNALCEQRERTVNLPTQEITSLRKTVEESRKEREERCAGREKEMSAEISALHHKYQGEMKLLEKERDGAVRREIAQKVAFMEKHLDSLVKVTKLETQICSMEGEWKNMCEILEEQLQNERMTEETWIKKEKDWLDSKERTKKEIQVLVDQIIILQGLASMSDQEKAKMKKEQEKAQKKAKKQRAGVCGPRLWSLLRSCVM